MESHAMTDRQRQFARQMRDPSPQGGGEPRQRAPRLSRKERN
jgi:hypothetical protein